MFDKHEHEYRQYNDGPELPADLAAFERQLARLSPASPRIDRDHLMFEAGRASALPDQDGRAMYIAGPSRSGSTALFSSSRFWPIAAATMTAASLLLSAMLLWQSPSAPTQTHVAQPAIPKQETAEGVTHLVSSQQMDPKPLELWLSTPAQNYLSIRQIALTHGVAALDRELDQGLPGDAPDGEVRHSPTTARELLDELLPESMAVSRVRI